MINEPILLLIDSFVTANNLEENLVGIEFHSRKLHAVLCFEPEQAQDLILGLRKSLDRLKQRKKDDAI